LKGIFTISLDFELHWGGFEKWDLDSKKKYFLNTRNAVPEMLQLFKEYEIHVTWATVGMLMHSNRSSLYEFLPVLKPSYVHQELSAYQFIDAKGIGEDENSDPFHYAGSIVKQIIETPNQELGSHTFGHFYCNEEGQTVAQFRADLRAAQKSAAAMYGKKLRSLVFPRNQFNQDYLKVCYEEGFTIVRDNPRDWFWNIDTRDESLWKRINRGADAYFPLGNKNAYRKADIPVVAGLPICLPASRLLRPYHPRELFLNSLKIKRINREVERAAKNGEIYHLWWHPHNFGSHPDESLRALKMILEHYSYCRKQWHMESLNMGELAGLFTL
jgi:peptidoglycan/xylan/chitin deacetylase (PgdA/CDA1 family)